MPGSEPREDKTNDEKKLSDIHYDLLKIIERLELVLYMTANDDPMDFEPSVLPGLFTIIEDIKNFTQNAADDISCYPDF